MLFWATVMAATAATAALTSKYLAFKTFYALRYVILCGRAYCGRDLSRKVSAFGSNSKAKYVKPRQKSLFCRFPGLEIMLYGRIFFDLYAFFFEVEYGAEGRRLYAIFIRCLGVSIGFRDGAQYTTRSVPPPLVRGGPETIYAQPSRSRVRYHTMG